MLKKYLFAWMFLSLLAPALVHASKTIWVRGVVTSFTQTEFFVTDKKITYELNRTKLFKKTDAYILRSLNQSIEIEIPEEQIKLVYGKK